MSWAEAVSLVVRTIAVPYGYTLAVWSSGMVAVGRYGHPTVREILLFVGGAVLGYLSLSLLTAAAPSPNGNTALRALALVNVVPILPALAVALLARNIKRRALGFFVIGLVATVVYVAGVGLLAILL